MKTLLVVIMIFAIVPCIVAQKRKKVLDDVYESGSVKETKNLINGTKLFGDIYYGMTKNDVRNVISSNRQGQELEVRGQIIEPALGYSTFDENKKLVRLAMVTKIDWKRMIGENTCQSFLISLDSVMAATGFKCTLKNDSWPNPILLSGHVSAAYERDDKIITAEVRTMSSQFFTVYPVYLFITTPQNISKENDQDMKELNKNINDAKVKL